MLVSVPHHVTVSVSRDMPEKNRLENPRFPGPRISHSDSSTRRKKPILGFRDNVSGIIAVGLGIFTLQKSVPRFIPRCSLDDLFGLRLSPLSSFNVHYISLSRRRHHQHFTQTATTPWMFMLMMSWWSRGALKKEPLTSRKSPMSKVILGTKSPSQVPTMRETGWRFSRYETFHTSSKVTGRK